MEMVKFGYQHILQMKKSLIIYVLLAMVSSIAVVLLPLIEGELINELVEKIDYSSIAWLIFMFTVLSLFLMIINVVINKLYLNIKLDAKNSLIMYVINRLYSLSLLELSKMDKSTLNERIYSDSETIIDFCISIYSGLILNLVSTMWIIFILCTQSFVLVFLIFILFVTYMLLYVIMRKFIYNANRMSKEAYTDYYSGFNKLNTCIKSIKINSFQDIVFHQQKNLYQTYKKVANNQMNVENINECISTFIGLCANIIIFLFGGFLVLQGKISLGLLIVISNYFSNLFTSADYYLNFGSSVQACKASYDRLSELLNIESIQDGKILLKSVDKISIQNLLFSYGSRSLISMNAQLVKGKIYWIKGKNGTGKSTFISVLSGLFGNQFKGKIIVNDIDFNDLNKAEFRQKHLALCEQAPYLLDGLNIIENIMLKQDADEKQSMLMEMIEGFQLNNVIENIKDSDLFEMNTKLSGGECQKIVLIRTLLSEAELLLFDEPTSALDQKSVQFFYHFLDSVKENKIIIIISHDYVHNYDEIIEI